ncbi:protein of unknown function [Blastococcus saxobsidens DD2]|uniref:Uncharacterized protein n=1 Tax=Blastococcus saxobsidens (strain DD2) TaxID=1146883 RepID=H6RL28_BLASD|nr:protein of unknown function [Blastococcus saxobsidens DD2]
MDLQLQLRVETEMGALPGVQRLLIGSVRW